MAPSLSLRLRVVPYENGEYDPLPLYRSVGGTSPYLPLASMSLAKLVESSGPFSRIAKRVRST